jgi:DNA polymerase III delta subunit
MKSALKQGTLFQVDFSKGNYKDVVSGTNLTVNGSCPSVRTDKGWNFTNGTGSDNLLNNNIVEALRCLDSYSMVQDNNVELVSFLYTYMEKMYRILLLKDEKVPPNDIASIVGIPRFLLTTRYLPKALAFGKNFIMEKINYICDLEVQLRKFKGNKRILIERFLFKFSK